MSAEGFDLIGKALKWLDENVGPLVRPNKDTPTSQSAPEGPKPTE